MPLCLLCRVRGSILSSSKHAWVSRVCLFTEHKLARELYFLYFTTPVDKFYAFI